MKELKFKPSAYSDVCEAQIFAGIVKLYLRHCEPLGWLFYEDGAWKETPYPRATVQSFCMWQLHDTCDNR